MKRTILSLLIGFVFVTAVFTVWAQDDTGKQYTAKDIIWRIHDQVDYLGGKKGYGSFIKVATDTEGKIYIAEASKEFNVLVIDAKTGKTLSVIKDSTGTIKKFYDATPAADGNIWVADYTSMVYLVDPTGKILLSVPFHKSPGMEDKQPIKVSVGPEGNLYVLYSSSALLMQVFTPKGEFVRSLVTGTDTLGSPNSFAFMPDGSLLIEADKGLAQLVEHNGKVTLKVFAEDFMKRFEIGGLMGLAINADGDVYFGSFANGIIKLDKDGKLLGRYGKGQEQINWGNDFGPDELSFTITLALDTDGMLIIADTNNNYSQLIKINMQD